MADFASWLIELLNSNSVDGDVFGEYISGSLETMEDSSEVDIKETLTEILSGCVEDQVMCEHICREITERWLLEKEQKSKELKTKGESSLILSSIGSVTSTPREPPAAAAKAPTLSSSEKDRLLAQYGCEEYEDDEPVIMPTATGAKKQAGSGGVFENTNRSSVTEEQRLSRDKQKAAHESKVERDKQNRLAQKQKAQDRKEKEKKRTQKQERRR